MGVPTDTLSGSDGPLLEVVQVGPLAVNTKLFAAIALVAVSNTALINMIMASRIVYGMARQGIIPSALGRVDATRGTPYVAILFTTAIAFVLIATGDLSTLADMTVLLLLLVFAVVNVAVLVLRRDHVDHDHFRIPTWVPLCGFVISFDDDEGGRHLPAGRRAARGGRGPVRHQPAAHRAARAVRDRGAGGAEGVGSALGMGVILDTAVAAEKDRFTLWAEEDNRGSTQEGSA
jgi:hypothetical protein